MRIAASLMASWTAHTSRREIRAARYDLRTGLERVVLETGRMANRLHGITTRRGLPAIRVDASQAHAVLSRMQDKTDADDAAMPSDPARTGFYRKVEIRSRDGVGRRALPVARDAAIGARRDVENTIRGLPASIGLRAPANSGRPARLAGSSGGAIGSRSRPVKSLGWRTASRRSPHERYRSKASGPSIFSTKTENRETPISLRFGSGRLSGHANHLQFFCT